MAELTEMGGAPAEEHGIRFLNMDWNDSITNGQPFTLTWNRSFMGDSMRLGVFEVKYPRNGLVQYELRTNLTGRLLLLL